MTYYFVVSIPGPSANVPLAFAFGQVKQEIGTVATHTSDFAGSLTILVCCSADVRLVYIDFLRCRATGFHIGWCPDPLVER